MNTTAQNGSRRTASWRVVSFLLVVALLATALPLGWIGGGTPVEAGGPKGGNTSSTPTPTPAPSGGTTSAPAPTPTPTTSTAESRVLPQLKNQAAANPTATYRVIVTRMNGSPQADQAVANEGGKKIKDVGGSAAFAATVRGDKIARLGQNPSIKYIAPDAQMIKTGTVDSSRLVTMYNQVIGSDQLWNSSGSGPAVTGLGVGVAVLDTGINPRADFSGRIATKVLFSSTAEKTGDGHGHGTHVAGVVAGNSWYATSTSGLQGKYVGVAPEARLINVRVSDEQGMSYVSDVVNAIDWVIANRSTYNIRVMNLSLISSVAESYTTSTLAAAVERAWFAGIFVVVAAGNLGPDTLMYPPANDPFVMTVGAADSMGTIDRLDDTIAPWSSYGTTQDGFVKPDVVAPGRNIVAPLSSSNATLATTYPERLVDGSYIRLSGTSMAAPVVAGVAALAFQAHPEWTNDQVKWLLQQTATRLSVYGSGAGEVDAGAVVRYAGTPGYANQNLTISQMLVSPDGSTNYSSASWSTASWSTASWSTASWSTASWSTASWSTASWSTASWSAATEKGVD